MRVRSVPFVLGMALLATLAAWSLLARDGGRPRSRFRAGAPEPEGKPPGLAASHREPVKEKPAVPAGFDPRPLESRIEGTVRRDGKPAAARVELRLVRREGPDGRSRLGLDRNPAKVALDAARAAPVAATEAGEDGRFVFKAVEPALYRVRAIGSEGTAGTATASIQAPGDREVVDVTLDFASAVLTGQVVHADGRPWQGDIVVVGLGGSWSPEEVGGARTDAEGRFTVGGLPARRVCVGAVAEDGGHIVGPTVEPPFRDECRIVWEDGRVSLTGRVLSAADRAPIAGAEVAAMSVPRAGLEFGSRDFAKTGEDGRFHVLAPADGAVLEVSAQGFVDAGTQVGSSAGDVEIVLVRGARARGVVRRRSDGGPVAGAEVTLLPVEGSHRDEWSMERRARADVDGRFAFEGLQGRPYLLVAHGPGQVSAAFLPTEPAARTAARVDLRPGDDVEVVLETVPAARVVGTVTDAVGAPVEGARVWASRRIYGRSRNADELPWKAYGFGSAYSGRGGAYELDSLIPGIEYEVNATAPGSPSSPERRVTALAGVVGRLDLVLEAARWIDVTVLEQGTDAPVAGASVHGYTIGASPEGEEGLGIRGSSADASGRTDAAGRVRLGPLGPGEFGVFVEAEGYASSNTGRRVEVIEGPQGRTATVRLERGSRIAGHVLHPGGEPAVGATVHLTTADGPGHASGTSVETGGDGAFAFEGLGEGARTVRATLEAEGLASETLPAPLGAVALMLRLEPRSVVARVLDPDGNPVPSAAAMFEGRGGCRSGNVRDGRVVFDLDDEVDVTSITGTLSVSGAADATGRRLPFGEARVEDVRPGREVVVRLPREMAIEGRVVGPDGKGVAGVRVRGEAVRGESGQTDLLESPWTWDLRGAEVVRTDEAGAFRLGHLTAGPHWVAVLPPLTFAPPPTTRQEAGATGVVVALRAAVSATVTVLAPDGRPAADGRVVAVRRAGQQFLVDELFSDTVSGWFVGARTGPDGKARLEGLDPAATYVLGARGPASAGFADALKDPWKPADTTLRLAAGLSVSGVARDASGKRLHGASIDCVDANGVSRRAVSAADGTFRLTGLPAGTVRLDADFLPAPLGLAEKSLRAEATVEAGTEGVDLRLR